MKKEEVAIRAAIIGGTVPFVLTLLYDFCKNYNAINLYFANNFKIDFFQNMYLSFSIPMRFNMFMWVMAFVVYFILDRYDNRLEVDKKREIKQINLKSHYFALYAFVVVAGLLSVGKYTLVIQNGTLDTIRLVTGIILTVVGFTILILGRVDIDGLWGPDIYKYHDPKADKLIQDGLYHKMRHPIYFGQITLALATCVVSPSAFFATFLIIVWWINSHRANVEEKHLAETFKESYKNYQIKTKKWYFI